MPFTIPQLIPEAYTVLSIGSLAVGVLALVVGWRAAGRAGRLEAHYRALMTGADGADIASALESHVARLGAVAGRVEGLEARTAGMDADAARLSAAEAHVARLQAQATDIDARLRRAVQHVRVLRYGAFADVGGDQSFALAMLDDHGDGVVVSGLHHRNGIRVYAKPLASQRSTYALTAEEAQAVAEASATAEKG